MRRTAVAAAIVATIGLLLTGSACTPSDEPAPALPHVAVRDDPTPPDVVVRDRPTPSPPASRSPEPAPFDVRRLPRPALDSILPAPRTDATLDDVHALGRTVFGKDRVSAIAHPLEELTPAYAAPDDTEPPIVALERTTLEQPAAWLTTAREGDWVQVLVPLGRGALPSDDPAAVNERAVWVRTRAVSLEPVPASVVVDVSERTATITDAEGRSHRVTVGVGKEGTETPRGLGSLVAFAQNPSGLTVAVTSMQSTSIDGYDGADYAAFALHPDPEHGVALGKARSNGCIRMDASDYAELVDHALPLGTPVWVVD